MSLENPRLSDLPAGPEVIPPGRKLLRINPDVLLSLGMTEGIASVGAPFPRDARVVGRSIDDRGDLVLIVESASFPEVLEGSACPAMHGLSFRMPTTRPRLLSGR
jgi:hypothetical protein